MVKVKICGITNLDDAQAAVESGADALGFVFVDASPRNVEPARAAEIIRHLPPFVQTVGLFVNQSQQTVNSIAERCGLDLIQLHGEETPEYCRGIERRIIKAFRIKDHTSLDRIDDYSVAACLLDAWSPAAHGGTGQTFNWEIAAAAARTHRIVLAGGLTPLNVASAVEQVRPYAVDVSSGVETAPGRKSSEMIRNFIAAARRDYRHE